MAHVEVERPLKFETAGIGGERIGGASACEAGNDLVAINPGGAVESAISANSCMGSIEA